MNPFETYRVHTELKTSFNLAQLKQKDIYLSKKDSYEHKTYNLKDSFEYSILQCIDLFDGMNTDNMNQNKFFNLARHYQHDKEIHNFSDLLLDAQFFEAEIIKLSSILHFASFQKNKNANYQKQLINSIETLATYFDKLEIDPVWFGSILYKNLQNHQSQYTEVIDVVRDKFLPVNSFFKNNIQHFHHVRQGISLYNPIYLMAFYNDIKGLLSHLTTTEFSNLDYLNVENYDKSKNLFAPRINKELEKEILSEFEAIPNSVLFDKRSLITKAFLCRHYDFVLPNKDVCMLIHFTNSENSFFKKAKDTDDLKKFYNNNVGKITDEKEALLLVNALHHDNPSLFKNWNWSAYNYFAIKELFRLPKLEENHRELNISRSELMQIPRIKKQIEAYAKTLTYQESFELCKLNFSNDFTFIKTVMDNNKDIKLIGIFLDLYLTPLKIIIKNNPEQDKLYREISQYIYPQLSRGIDKPEILALLEKQFLNLSIGAQNNEENLIIKKRL